MPFAHHPDGQRGHEQIRRQQSNAIRKIGQDPGSCLRQTQQTSDPIRKDPVFPFGQS